MEFSENIFRRRIASQLPASTSRSAANAAGRSGSASIDVSDLCAIHDDEGFAQEAYRRILGRDCDVSGFVNCLEMLRSNIPRRMIVLQLINSEEARRRGVEFLGIPASTTPRNQRRQRSLSFTRVGRGLLARLYEIARRLWFVPFNSIDQKLSLVLREVAVRADGLSLKTDEALSTLSQKLDAYVGDLQARTHELHGEIAAQHGASEVFEQEIARIARTLTGIATGIESILSVLTNLETQESELKRRLHPPVLLAGNNVLVTEVDGFIVGFPGEEWRLAAYHAFRGVPEPGVARRFQSLIRPGMVVVDIGANIGMYTLYAARLLATRGKVYSFEPTPRIFQILKDNVQVNGLLELGVVELREAAVSDRVGTAQLAVFADNCGHNTLFFGGDNVQQVSVSTVTLDQALDGETSIDIVKIDAEGAEPFIVRGMRQILDHNPGIRIVLEFAPVHLRRAGIDPGEFLAEIASMGFGIHRIHDESGELMETLGPDLTEMFSVNLELARDIPHSGGSD